MINILIMTPMQGVPANAPIGHTFSIIVLLKLQIHNA